MPSGVVRISSNRYLVAGIANPTGAALRFHLS
jgi:hypothetical protein